MKPVISIIIPVYNTENYLAECLDSVLSQDYDNYEVVLVDDGSMDTSGAICDEYAVKDNRIRAIHKKNGGPSETRNVGIEAAKGDWIIFLDSDDLWNSNDVLSTLYNYATNLNLDILRYELRQVSETLVPLNLQIKDKTAITHRVLTNYELVRYGVDGEWFVVLFLFKKSLLGSDIRFNVAINSQEDIDFYCRLFAKAEYRCGYMDTPFYLYRKGGNSITTTYKISNLDGSFRLCDVFWEEAAKTVNNKLASLYRYYGVMMYCWTLRTLSESPYYEKRKEIIKQLSLKDLQRRTVARIKDSAIKAIYLPFIVFSPSIVSFLLRQKNKVVSTLHRLK